jgi:hypothetical protein
VPEIQCIEIFKTLKKMSEPWVELPDYLEDVAEFAYLTGWRRSEITKTLTWSCMNWDTMVLRLPTSKNSEGRVFPIVQPRLEALLKRRLEKR